MQLTKKIRAARRVSTPLIAISTPDPAATVQTISEELNSDTPRVQWDIVRGLRALNSTGAAVVKEMTAEGDSTVGNSVEAIIKANELPDGAMMFVLSAHRFLDDTAFVQAVWNLRDEFKQNKRTLFLLGPEIKLPLDLAGDVLALDEPLPDEQHLTAIVSGCFDDAQVEAKPEEIGRGVEAVLGLPAAQADQATAMALSRDGLDLDDLWELKRKQIETTDGLSVYRDAETFDDVGGVEFIKQYLIDLMADPETRPNAIISLDEIEKTMAGAFGAGDTSGTSSDQFAKILSYMNDKKARGMIFVGPPGSAKSMIMKAAGAAGGIPTIDLDLGAMKGSLVGQSEQRLRAALKVISAVSNDRSFWIATCNSIDKLPGELRRRFNRGVFFFDLPTPDERAEIWQKQLEAHGMDPATPTPPDDKWTGAEIKVCCDIAGDLKCSLERAASYVVPVAKQAPETLEKLRTLADGRFLSASYEGVYERDRTSATVQSGTKRRIDTDTKE